jgi:hypothetical protein
MSSTTCVEITASGPRAGAAVGANYRAKRDVGAAQITAFAMESGGALRPFVCTPGLFRAPPQRAARRVESGWDLRGAGG